VALNYIFNIIHKTKHPLTSIQEIMKWLAMYLFVLMGIGVFESIYISNIPLQLKIISKT